MKKSAFALLFFLLLAANSINGFAQSNQHLIDSLTKALSSSKEDTNKVKVLVSLSVQLLHNNPEQSLAYSNQSLALAQKFNQTKGLICSYQNIAGYYYYRGDMVQAETYSQKAISLIQSSNNKADLADAYNKLSAISSRKGDYAGSLNYLKKALELSKETKDTAQIVSVLCNTGITYMMVSDYITALNYFMDDLKIADRLSYQKERANCYLNIGKIYWLGYHNAGKTIYYSTLAFESANQGNDRFTAAAALELTGESYKLNKNWDKALEYFQQSLEIDKKMGNFPLMVANMGSIASIYSEQGKFKQAIDLMNEAIALAEKIGDKDYALCSCYGTLGNICLKKKDYNAAITYLNKSLEIARSVNMRNNETVALLDLSKCYEAQKNYAAGFNALSLYTDIKDSMINEESVRKTAQMEALYNFNNKEKEITLLTKDKEMQKMQINYLKIASLGGFILFTILFLLIYRNYRIRQSLKLQTLRNKLAIDLHDEVGSTLSSISIFSEIAREQSKEVAPLLDQIKENCRKIIESMADIVWTINPENDNFENIIIRMRSFAYELLGTKKINFEFNADNSVTNMKLPMEARKNLYLIFKEATNNMVKYADANSASFSITRSKNNLTMLISDNGKGFETEKETSGNGLKNMKARAMEMGAKFLIESTPGKGTTIQLLLKTA